MATKLSKNGKPRSPRATNAPAIGRWLPRLGMYHTKRALTFENEEERNRAIDAIWDPRDDLYRMPNAPADTLTMIVPDDAVQVFRVRKFKFEEHPVGSFPTRP